jgi:Cytochrome C oxidase assembly factor 2
MTNHHGPNCRRWLLLDTTMRPLNAAQRYRLTSSLFLLTFFGAVFTVAAPSVFPCPAFQHRPGQAYADGWSWDGLASERKRRRVVIKKEEREAPDKEGDSE